MYQHINSVNKESAWMNALNMHFFNYPTPANLSYLWNFGFISAVFLGIQLVSGIFLSMHYSPDVATAFDSVEHIVRDVNYGWFLSFVHANGASFFFIVVYLHIASNIYYQRYHHFNINVWTSGMIIFFLMMAIAFIGYVLPWGQMSFWGATVITNLFSAIPLVGDDIVLWIWGGFSVGGPTLSSFFSLHYILPFILAAISVLHIVFLHERGSFNPDETSNSLNVHHLPLYPYYILNDMVGLLFVMLIFMYFVCFIPDFLGHSDNYLEADPLSTPPHIVPEWYFLPFYAILSSIPSKFFGVLAMFLSIVLFFIPPFFSNAISNLRFGKQGIRPDYVFTVWYDRFIHPIFSVFFYLIVWLLGWIGSNPVEEPFITIGHWLVFFYFFVFTLLFLIFPIYSAYLNELNQRNITLEHFFQSSVVLLVLRNFSRFGGYNDFWGNEGFIFNTMDWPGCRGHYQETRVTEWWLDVLRESERLLELRLWRQYREWLAEQKNNPNIVSIPVMSDIFFEASTFDYECNTLFFLMFLFSALTVSTLLFFLSAIISNWYGSTPGLESSSPFECGFDMFFFDPTINANIFFFRVALIFILFDLEIIFLIPWSACANFFLVNGLYFMFFAAIPFLFFLFLGVVYECVYNLTDWSVFNY